MNRIAPIRTVIFFLLFIALLAPPPVSASASFSVVSEDQFFDSEGVRIRFIDVGPRDGEPVLLIHGGFSNLDSQWIRSGVIDALDEAYRVIALDLRGHGLSDKPHDPEMYGNAMVLDVVRLLNHLEIEKAHIVGYSMGGAITYRLVADHPRLVISAMPCGTGYGPPSQVRTEMLERVAKSLEESGSIRPALDHYVTDGSLTEAQVDRIVESTRESNDTMALAAVVRSIPRLRPDRAKLEANQVPCLCIIGENDPNREALDAMLQYMPHLEAKVIKDANHMTAYRDPQFIASIVSFIGMHDSEAASDDGSR
ncbi:MAG: alpha/beta fold hydrolase [Planctomycetota bacterium]|nr:alpha/beta fold hydrolase [Planctomycetota bacterium]